MSKHDVLIFRIGRELLKGLEDAPLFPEYLEDGGKEEQQWESHSQLDEVTPGEQPLQQQREAGRKLGNGHKFMSIARLEAGIDYTLA